MTSSEIRKKYFDFFENKKHKIISSSSLIPENDSSLLFTNSGMFPLVPYLLGESHPGGKLLANSQKCFRSEDIDEVGDGRHNTFFEMLGNWSLGDYFKKEQLNWWFEFMIEDLGLDISKIYQTVYVGDGKNISKDTESIEILKNIYLKYGIEANEGPETITKGDFGPQVEIDFSKDRIFAYRDKNWWQRGDAVGELGGPDSETFYDTGKKHDLKFGKHCHLNCDCGRFIEIGNSVFMQYQKTDNGWQELKNKNVDFGGGLERIVMVKNSFSNIFKIDSLNKIIERIEEVSGLKYENHKKSFEVISDHVKAVSFLLGDDKKLSPSNSDQGYVIRRLIRRALRYSRQININKDYFLSELSEIVIDFYKDFYQELDRNRNFVFDCLKDEESKFAKTIERGEKILNSLAEKSAKIDGYIAFDLFQSHGYPFEMTEEIINEKNIVKSENFVNEYKQEFARHQELSKTASAGKFKGGLADQSEATTKLHTAAHLLLAALRKVLGDHVSQRGSNITAERLRFDFSHSEKMTEEQKKQVEQLVNDAIAKSYDVKCQEMNLQEAKDMGASGVFDSKYGEKVKVYTVGDFSDFSEVFFSKEICGGPHVDNVSDLGVFKIQKEESSSAGVRRIKAVLLERK
ncbi:alanine--tRNA ligase [Candidatus Falkowbacteria bacterium HGW-Falkowbacteria-1]|uniref:alanine--tRNA ligase n=1 Tax=Candidatus Falkowbacteria bacterium HGW-Falkowbacteria-1 TaxID=2013768 RepID=A0A2N2E9N9_9BACT|nr:MAG: alanine--tRNA ligase [Candidatus Falkowbacteria bacterium HGW-Falkowbacteria-1]